MKRDSRLSQVLHALLHMADQEGPVTSDQIAQWLHTNPVVVRRTMGLLRKAGLVRSDRGHAGGWRICSDLSEITLLDLHAALGEPALFALANREDAPDCLVEQAVNTALDDTFAQAEALILERFGTISLQSLADDFSARLALIKQQRESHNV